MIVFVIMYVAALFCVFVGYVTVFELLKEGRGACVHGREHLKSLLLTAEPAFVSLDYGVAAGKLKAKGANTRTENAVCRGDTAVGISAVELNYLNEDVIFALFEILGYVYRVKIHLLTGALTGTEGAEISVYIQLITGLS